MQKLFRCATLVVFVLAAATSAAAGELRLSIANGRVTLIAQDVPVRDILAEWARVGGTTIVNGEKLFGPPVTLQLVDVPEAQAIETLLRSASGYVVAPRAAASNGASAFDRIMILPTSNPPAYSPPPAAFRPQQQMMPMPMPMPVPVDPAFEDDDDGEPGDQGYPMPPGVVPPPEGMQAPPVMPQPGMMPQPTQDEPVLTSPVPGQLPPPATVPGYPGYPGQPNPNPNPNTQPVRRPGGGR